MCLLFFLFVVVAVIQYLFTLTDCAVFYYYRLLPPHMDVYKLRWVVGGEALREREGVCVL